MGIEVVLGEGREGGKELGRQWKVKESANATHKLAMKREI